MYVCVYVYTCETSCNIGIKDMQVCLSGDTSRSFQVYVLSQKAKPRYVIGGQRGGDQEKKRIAGNSFLKINGAAMSRTRKKTLGELR